MKHLKVMVVLAMVLTGFLTSCTNQELNEDNQFEENFQGVDKGIQRPGTQGQTQQQSI